MRDLEEDGEPAAAEERPDAIPTNQCRRVGRRVDELEDLGRGHVLLVELAVVLRARRAFAAKIRPGRAVPRQGRVDETRTGMNGFEAPVMPVADMQKAPDFGGDPDCGRRAPLDTYERLLQADVDAAIALPAVVVLTLGIELAARGLRHPFVPTPRRAR